jgi:hypothetical protein
MSPDLLEWLDNLRLVERTGANTMRVQRLRLRGELLPDAEVGASRRTGRLPLRADAILGLNYLNLFESILLQPAPTVNAMRLTLTLSS